MRYRVDYPPVPGLRCRADVVFTRARLAIFVDGCFWHCCPIHATRPAANADWWRAKLEANVARDRRNDRELSAAGWSVLRCWEHETAAEVADRISAALQAS